MAYWLLKSEPQSWSFAQQVEAGEAGTSWNGVRNHVAKQNLMAMHVGDRAFFYHSNQGKEIVGVVEVTRVYHPDPTDPTGRFGMVDVKAVAGLPKPVSLAAIRADARLGDMMLVKNSRMSVQPVTDADWAVVIGLGGA